MSFLNEPRSSETSEPGPDSTSVHRRQQISLDALEEQEKLLAETLEGIVGNSPANVISGVFNRCATNVAQSEYTMGCPATDLVVNSDGDVALERSAQFFASVIELVAGHLRTRGLSAEDAREVATVSLAAMGGAVTLARAHRSLEPFETVLRELLQHPSLQTDDDLGEPMIVAVR